MAAGLVLPHDREPHRLRDPRLEKAVVQAAAETGADGGPLTVAIPAIDEERDPVLERPLRLPLGDLGVSLVVEPEGGHALGVSQDAPPEIEPARLPERAVHRADEDIGGYRPWRRNRVEFLERASRQEVHGQRVRHHRPSGNSQFEHDLSRAGRLGLDDEMNSMLSVGGGDPDRGRGWRREQSHARSMPHRGGHIAVGRAVIDDKRREADRAACPTQG
jgi:hypothetical protein